MRPNLEYVLNHVFFPLRLPQKSDHDDTIGVVLIEELLTALRLLQDKTLEQQHSEWTPCIKMLSNMLELRDHLGGLIPQKMQVKLKDMQDQGRC